MNKKRELQLESLIEKMMCVMKSFHAHQGIPFGEFKLSRPQVMVLFFVFRQKDGATGKDLAKFLNVTSGAVTQFIDVLVKKKLLQREEDSKDRRILRIRLTSMAQEKFASFKKSYYKSMGPAFKGLSEAEIEQLAILIQKIKTVKE